MRGHSDDGNVFDTVFLAQLRGCIIAIQHRHLHVHQYKIEWFIVLARGQKTIDAFLAVGGGCDVETSASQQLDSDFD